MLQRGFRALPRGAAARVIAAIALAVCVGCSANNAPTATSAPDATDAASATESASASQTSAPWEVSPQTAGGATIGQTVTASSGGSRVEITVHDLRRTTAADAGGTQDVVGIDAEVCPNFGITVSSEGHWVVLAKEKGKGNFQPSETNPAGFTPEFPYQPKPTGAGQCVRGWVTFQVDPGVALGSIRYLGVGNINIGWVVPQQ